MSKPLPAKVYRVGQGQVGCRVTDPKSNLLETHVDAKCLPANVKVGTKVLLTAKPGEWWTAKLAK